MTTLILVLLAFAAGYATCYFGWAAIRSWIMIAVAALAGWWEQFKAFIDGFVG